MASAYPPLTGASWLAGACCQREFSQLQLRQTVAVASITLLRFGTSIFVPEIAFLARQSGRDLAGEGHEHALFFLCLIIFV
jgi:hypothetical protein